MEKIIKKYALQNALRHGGKAKAEALIGKLIQEDASLKEIQRLVKSLKKSMPFL